MNYAVSYLNFKYMIFGTLIVWNILSLVRNILHFSNEL
jgi:hypothetical protein